jgi:hypothetical protein
MVLTEEELRMKRKTLKRAYTAHLADTTDKTARKLVKRLNTEYTSVDEMYKVHSKYSIKKNATAIVRFGVNAKRIGVNANSNDGYEEMKERHVFYLLDTEGPEEGLFVMPAE